MSEQERDTLMTITDAIPKMSDFQKGRLYGIAERIMEEEETKKQEEEGR